MKRSFAEFYAQRATPELLQAVQAGSEVLRRLQTAPWPVTHVASSRDDVLRMYELTQAIHEALGGSARADVLLSRGAESFLKAGCVVVVTREDVGNLPELAVVLGDAPVGAWRVLCVSLTGRCLWTRALRRMNVASEGGGKSNGVELSSRRLYTLTLRAACPLGGPLTAAPANGGASGGAGGGASGGAGAAKGPPELDGLVLSKGRPFCVVVVSRQAKKHPTRQAGKRRRR